MYLWISIKRNLYKDEYVYVEQNGYGTQRAY